LTAERLMVVSQLMQATQRPNRKNRIDVYSCVASVAIIRRVGWQPSFVCIAQPKIGRHWEMWSPTANLRENQRMEMHCGARSQTAKKCTTAA